MTAKILFVDDDRELLESLRDALRKKPYDILTSDAAGRALEMLGMHDIDVVVSDERMPGLVGSEFLTQVRVRFPRVVRILLTGHASVEAIGRAVNEGQIFRYLAKPIEPALLDEAIQAALAHRPAKASSDAVVASVDPADPYGLEARYPGITQVSRTDTGSIVIEDDF